MVGEEDFPDEVEERLVNEEYKIWKKNTPFLYGEWSENPYCKLFRDVNTQDVHLRYERESLVRILAFSCWKN